MNAAEFNALYDVGVPVFAYPGARPEDFPKATRLVTRTRSKASVLGGHTDVVWVDGHSACIALSHVDVVSEAAFEEALLADTVKREGALPMPAGPEPKMGGRVNTTVCPINPSGHDWQNGLTCHWCDTTRTPGEAIVSGLASRRGGSEGSARSLLDAYRTEAIVEALRGAAESAAEIHHHCHRTVCAACEVRRDILDVLTSVADVLGEKSTPAGAQASREVA